MIKSYLLSIKRLILKNNVLFNISFFLFIILIYTLCFYIYESFLTFNNDEHYNIYQFIYYKNIYILLSFPYSAYIIPLLLVSSFILHLISYKKWILKKIKEHKIKYIVGCPIIKIINHYLIIILIYFSISIMLLFIIVDFLLNNNFIIFLIALFFIITYIIVVILFTLLFIIYSIKKER
jgi:hypothetical protein